MEQLNHFIINIKKMIQKQYIKLTEIFKKNIKNI